MALGGIQRPSLSPGEALRLQRQTEQVRSRQAQLAAALLRNEVFPEDLQRLGEHLEKALVDPSQVNHFDVDFLFARMTQMNANQLLSSLRSVRE